MTDIEFLEKMIDEQPTLDELLSRADMTEADAAAAAHLYRRRYSELLENTGLSGLHKPKLWMKFIEGCKVEMTDDRRELMTFLLAGGSLLTDKYDSSEDMVCAWLETSEHQRNLFDLLQTRREKAAEFSAISSRIAKASQPKKYTQTSECSAAFPLLCLDDYAPCNADLQILLDNLVCIDSLIAAADLLAIAPLVYFQIYTRNRKKLYEKPDYLPTLKTIFNPETYGIESDNGKNFNQYMLYIQLYLELKECFPDADYALCDAGFTACSNLADWCWENIEQTEDMPITNRALVESFAPMCFENPWEDIAFWNDENVKIEQLWKWQESMTAVRARAKKAVECVSFGDIAEFAENSSRFLAGVFERSGICEIIRPAQLPAARALLAAEIQARFDELLVAEVAELLGK